MKAVCSGDSVNSSNSSDQCRYIVVGVLRLCESCAMMRVYDRGKQAIVMHGLLQSFLYPNYVG